MNRLAVRTERVSIDWIEQGYRVHACLLAEAGSMAEMWIVARAEAAV